jgi:transcriptional regulator
MTFFLHLDVLDVSSQGEDSSRISKELENLRSQIAMKEKELLHSQEKDRLTTKLALMTKENEELKAQEVLRNNV